MLTPMQMLIAAAVVIHAVAAVFWMSSSGMIARSGGQGAEMLFPRQMIAAFVVVLTGGFLWSQLHMGGVGPYEMVLGAGAALAILALLIQGAVVGTSLGKLKAGGDVAAVRKRVCGVHRVAVALLGLCFACMIVARFI
jgi:hypothetical protein